MVYKRGLVKEARGLVAVEDFAKFAHEGCFGERLFDEVDAFAQHAVVDNRVTGVPGHVDNS